ncbi:hypothetical protein PINS_up001998 [Pythium insidiosum]|nr:hypothetical protein PINS_up001998 [Pythium insidiosum]
MPHNAAQVTRASIRDLVDLCSYVAQVDVEKQANPTAYVPSYQKARWMRGRNAKRDAEATDKDAQGTTVSSNTEAIESAHSNQSSAAKRSIKYPNDHVGRRRPGDRQASISAISAIADDSIAPTFEIDAFLREFIATDVNVSDARLLPSTASDPLAVTSFPSRREGYSLTLCREQRLLVFGGRILKDLTNLLPLAASVEPFKLERVRYVFSNALYQYDIATGQWHLRQCSGRVPRERSDHTAAFVDPLYLVVCGGRGRHGAVFEDLFVLSVDDWHWSEIDTRTRVSERYWHAFGALNGHFYVFGGKSDTHIFGDLQQLEANGVLRLLASEHEKAASGSHRDSRISVHTPWIEPSTVGKAPSARFGARLVVIGNDQIIVIGGWRAKRGRDERGARLAPPKTMDVFILDTATMVWTKPRVSSHVSSLTAPCERFLFDCCFAFGTLVISGGFTYSSDGALESYRPCEEDQYVYKLDLRRMIWRRQPQQQQERENNGDVGGALAHYCCDTTLFSVVETSDAETVPSVATIFTAMAAKERATLAVFARQLTMTTATIDHTTEER